VSESAVHESPDAARERHATNLELFLDLVFVLAITQIATLISHDPTVGGLFRGLLIAWLVWWQWSQFTWVGSAIDLQAVSATRVIVLCIIPVTLVMSVSIPTVFEDGGLWFAGTYLGILLLVLLVQGRTAWHDERTRISFVRYGSTMVIAPFLVLLGAFVHGHARTGWWLAAAIVDVIAAARAGGAGEWTINPVHFAERHALFVIISLGEVLVATGVTATGVGLTGETVLGIVVAVAVACVLWWTYFAYIPEVAERRLAEATGLDRGRFARDFFTLGHFPLVAGLVMYAVVAKHLVEHPTDELNSHDRWTLALSALFFVGGLMGIQYRAIRRVAPERVIALVVIAGLAVLGRWLPGALVVALVALALGVMQAVTLRRMRPFRPAAR
jgi:low temperature requirement protein LtrA